MGDSGLKKSTERELLNAFARNVLLKGNYYKLPKYKDVYYEALPKKVVKVTPYQPKDKKSKLAQKQYSGRGWGRVWDGEDAAALLEW